MKYLCNNAEDCNNSECAHKEIHEENSGCNTGCHKGAICEPFQEDSIDDLQLCEKAQTCQDSSNCIHQVPHIHEDDCDKPTDCNAFCRTITLTKEDLQAKLDVLNKEMTFLDKKVEHVIAKIRDIETQMQTAPNGPQTVFPAKAPVETKCDSDPFDTGDVF